MSRTLEIPLPGQPRPWHEDLVFEVSPAPDNTAVEREAKDPPAPSTLEELPAVLSSIPAQAALGTALGDWLADTGGLRYEGGALVFGGCLAVVAALYFWTRVSRVALFWAAFILTRPLGPTVGDFLYKPVSHGGLSLSRPLASAIIGALILAALVLLPQRAGRHPGAATASS